MGIRFTADHLTCPACGSALSPDNRRETDTSPVTDVLVAYYPHWNTERGACEACVGKAYQRLPQPGLIGRLRGRFGIHAAQARHVQTTEAA